MNEKVKKLIREEVNKSKAGSEYSCAYCGKPTPFGDLTGRLWRCCSKECAEEYDKLLTDRINKKLCYSCGEKATEKLPSELFVCKECLEEDLYGLKVINTHIKFLQGDS